MSVVLVVFFGSDECVPRHVFYGRQFPVELFGLTLWIPNRDEQQSRQIVPPPPPIHYITGPVFRWSVDMVSCGDERWTVFGPFESAESALVAFKTIPSEAVRGYRIINRHCYRDVMQYKQDSWTDG